MTQTIYAKLDDPRRGIVYHYPAEYADGTWTRKAFAQRRYPDSVKIYAYSGRQASVYTDMSTIRLAHTLMPNAPCSCPTVHQYWEEDITDAEITTPYGNSKGALAAWSMDARAKVGQGGSFPRVR